MRQRTDDLLSQCGLQTAMHPGLGLQPTMPHLPYCTMQAGMPLTGTLVPVQQMHYPMGQTAYLACAEPAAKKQKAVPTQSTAQLHLDMVDDYIKIQVDQQRGSVAASMGNPRKRKLNAKNAKALHRSLLSTPDLPHTPGHSLQPAPPHPCFPDFFDTTPNSRHAPIARCDPHAHNSVIRHLWASNPPIHQTTALLDPSGCRPSRPSRCPEYGPVCTAAAAPRAFSLPGRQLPHVRSAHPASLGRLSAPLLCLTMAPLGQPAPRPLLDCHGISKSRI